MSHKLLPRLLRNLWPLRPADRWLLLETFFYLLAARLALRVLPFRWLIWWFQRPICPPAQAGEARRAVIQKVCLAIYFTDKWLDLNAVCFPRSMAAQAMLRHRGVSTTLYYGAATSPEHGKLLTHVWLQDGDEGIIAHEDVSPFQVLARYEPLSQATHQ